MDTNTFNTKAARSNIGSKSPIQSSQYKHSREYDHRMLNRIPVPISDSARKGVRIAILGGMILWVVIIAVVVRIF